MWMVSFCLHCESLIINAKMELTAEFKMMDLGRVTVFLGVRFHFLKEGLFLEQQEYSKLRLAIFSMEKCNHTSTPMLPRKNKWNGESADKDKPFSESTFRKAIGGLLHLSTWTRSDIAHAVGFVSRKSSSPSESDWTDVKRIMRYIQGSLCIGLFYKRAQKFVPEVFGF